MGGFPLGNWSGNSQLWWTGTKVGDELVVELDIAKAGKHELFATFTKAIDYGIIQLFLNGNKIGHPIDGFNTAVTNTGPLSFGTHDFVGGKNRLAIKVTDKNPKATGTMVGIDYIWLKSE